MSGQNNIPNIGLTPEQIRIKPLTLGELAERPPRNMLIKGLLGVGEMSVFFGEPKCGKSFLVTDLGLAVALGIPWFGKKVRQGPVLYVAAEGAGGFAKRIDAYKDRHEDVTGNMPFNVILSAVDLLNPDADVQPLVYWAKVTQAKLVIIDTLSRTMPGGNENSPEDMSAYIANCDRIREATAAHVLVVHHCHLVDTPPYLFQRQRRPPPPHASSQRGKKKRTRCLVVRIVAHRKKGLPGGGGRPYVWGISQKSLPNPQNFNNCKGCVEFAGALVPVLISDVTPSSSLATGTLLTLFRAVTLAIFAFLPVSIANGTAEHTAASFT